jgi:FAD/FMN-containing dehydrogenase
VFVGYSLGGGISWFARKYGLAANSVTAIELVNADGELVRADAENESELYWALRGGGGSFGVVTALEFALYPIPELHAGVLFCATIPVEQLKHLHMDPEHPVPGAGDGMLLGDFTDEAIEAVVAAAGAGSGSPLLSVEVRHLGGALGRMQPGHGALATIEAEFAMFAVGISMTPEMGAAVRAHIEVVLAALAPWDAGTTTSTSRSGGSGASGCSAPRRTGVYRR